MAKPPKKSRASLYGAILGDMAEVFSRTGPHPLDNLLRKYGFRIYVRERRKEPVWIREREAFLQSQALATIPKNEVADASFMLDLYWSRYDS